MIDVGYPIITVITNSGSLYSLSLQTSNQKHLKEQCFRLYVELLGKLLKGKWQANHVKRKTISSKYLRTNKNPLMKSQVFPNLKSRYKRSWRKSLTKKNQKKKRVRQIWKVVAKSQMMTDYF